MNSLPHKAKLLLYAVVVCALALSATLFANGSRVWSNGTGNAHFLVVLVLAIAAARMKVSLPGIESNMCMNLPFILIAAFELAPPQALIVGAVSTFAQCLPGFGKQLSLMKTVFNVCSVSIPVSLASLVASRAMHIQNVASTSLFVATSAAVFFFALTIPVAGIIATSENGKVWRLWREISGLTLPYFVLSAGAAMLVVGAGYYRGLTFLLTLLLMFCVWNSFKRYFHHTASDHAMAAHA